MAQKHLNSGVPVVFRRVKPEVCHKRLIPVPSVFLRPQSPKATALLEFVLPVIVFLG